MQAVNSNIKVAVIGSGAAGLVALKNMLEEGYHAVGFERKSYVGGLWKYTLDNTTSVLPTTMTNISKQRGCFTDFPFPDDTPTLCSSADVETYLERYADHFQLWKHIRFNTSISSVKRDDANNQWMLDVVRKTPEGDATETVAFDKVIIASGANEKPRIPIVEGIENFAGRVLHSQAFKNPEDFKDKSVLIVGIGSTAADTAVSLLGHASKIYISHRNGAHIFPRRLKGRPIDQGLTYRLLNVQAFLNSVAPSLVGKLFDAFAGKMQDSAFPTIRQHPEWRISPAPSMVQSFPTVSDELVPALERGDVVSVPGLRRVSGPRSVELEPVDAALKNLEHLDDIDAIILCTGYNNDLGISLLEPRVRPTREPTAEWLALSGGPDAAARPLLRLYRGLLSVDYPDSLAVMGAVLFPTSAFQLFDIASMAIAQLWSPASSSSLPPRAEMERAVDAHYAWLLPLARRGPVHPGLAKQDEWLAWAEAAAGTNVGTHLGWGSGLKGWAFWWKEHRLCTLLTSGVMSPHLYRLFDSGGKRKAWPCAREAIERMNLQLAEEMAKMKQA